MPDTVQSKNQPSGPVWAKWTQVDTMDKVDAGTESRVAVGSCRHLSVVSIAKAKRKISLVLRFAHCPYAALAVLALVQDAATTDRV